MINYKQLPQTGNVLGDLFAGWYNKYLMRRLVTRIAWNIHLKSGREVHIAELFGALSIFDTREKADLNKAGTLGRMESLDLAKASIWNSTAHRRSLEKKAPALPYTLPKYNRNRDRKKIISEI